MSEFPVALPAPLVDAEVDLRDFPDMMLDVRKLRDSRFGAEVTGEAFRAGVMLWCAAWHQVPAGSLPDDDVELGNLAGFGRVIGAWREVREQALQGFVKCSDGRLYHETVSEVANAAWRKRLEHFYERACERFRKSIKDTPADKRPKPISFDDWNRLRLVAGLRADAPETSAEPGQAAPVKAGNLVPPETPPPSGGKNLLPADKPGTSGKTKPMPKSPKLKTDVPAETPHRSTGTTSNSGGNGARSGGNGADGGGIPAENALKGEGEIRESLINTEAKASAVASPGADDSVELSAKDVAWSLGVALLGDKGRGMLGKLAKTYGDHVLLEALRAAQAEMPLHDPKSWLVAACEARKATAQAEKASVQTTIADLANRDPHPAWLEGTGFDNLFVAESEGCFEHNRAQWRDGKRIAGGAR